MPRTTRSISASTAVPKAPAAARELDLRAGEALSRLGDQVFVRVRIDQIDHDAMLPVTLLRRFFEAVRDDSYLLVFEAEEEVSTEVAARLLGVSRPHLVELLDLESIPYRRVGNQRRIRVAELEAFRARRERRTAGMRAIAAVVDESSSGWR